MPKTDEKLPPPVQTIVMGVFQAHLGGWELYRWVAKIQCAS